MAHVSDVFERSFPDADRRWQSYGIDISGNQPATVVSDLWSAGHRFDQVIVKSSEGSSFRSEEAAGQIADCEALGLPWGVYHYLTFSGVLGEIRNLIQTLETLPPVSKVWLDCEEGDFESHNVPDGYDTYIDILAKAIEAYGCTVGIYTGVWWANNVLRDGSRPLWVSDYSDGQVWPSYPNPRLPDVWVTAEIWQFTNDSPEFGSLDLNAMAYPTQVEEIFPPVTLLGGRWLFDASPMLAGDDVAELQNRLIGLGFDPGSPDGVFGPLTEAAVIAFQQSAGLDDDGIVGPLTVAALIS